MSKWVDDNKPMLKGGGWGFVAGVAALAIYGFTYGGWYTQSSAQKYAESTADTAVQAALTPVCVSEFMGQPNAQAQLVALKAKQDYDRGDMIGKVIKIAGQKSLPDAVSSACAEKLVASMKTAHK